MEPVIELTRLSKKYDHYTAVNQLDLTIYRGEVFGLLGPNGAGKTTTILMMLGLTERSSGDVKVLGLDPNQHAITIKSKVGYMPDDIGFYDDRSAIDNLIYTARLNGIKEKEARMQAEQLLHRVGLADAATKKVSSFSRGMRQRLGLADVLIKQPEIIILDEPTLGIDPEGVRELLELISQLSKEEGITVLLCSHHLHQVQQVCDRVGLFVKGELVACGNIHQLSQAINQDSLTTIELEIKHYPASLQAALQELEQVASIQAQSQPNGEEMMTALSISCTKDITPVIAKLATEHTELYMIHRKDYGLDDIYHQYFEGGETRETALKAK
ncbi:ABC transporter ATP-binding protein [Paenibacillus sp. FSL W7-1287]|uniref:ABC transporter ATP-binding protein n=1 Tax=Paenibacillus sp. FSL W7-1287 TaxID=2954538 RepID=UPI0030F77187